MTSTVPFRYLMHLLTVPVSVGDTETRFIFDTGIGVNLVSDSLARAVGAAPSGSVFTGRRMSGQEVTAPMSSLASVRLGERRSRDVPRQVRRGLVREQAERRISARAAVERIGRRAHGGSPL